ncbi:MAG TPA: peptidoglycan bridge formation glycyltransferase FemA/FemB family protein [Nocardioidaceae bacterium]|nr:peptidoglycan bridge formation glycyltransferase FemA/FemB family protein [Nocardioidaceae bacterium]
MTSAISVRTITPAEHLAFVRARESASFLQTPAWARVKSEWGAESVGFYAGAELVGAGLVLYRQLPRLRRYLAYLPEGPVLDWSRPDLAELLAALAAHARANGAFAVRIGAPVRARSWQAGTVKAAIAGKAGADDASGRLSDIPADDTTRLGRQVEQTLRSGGWKPLAAAGGFTAGQPKYVFQVPLAGRDEDAVLTGMNQLWRRNIKKAAKAGVEVRVSDGAQAIEDFHRIYLETARRDGFTPRPLTYFHSMHAALSAEDADRIRIYLAHHEGDLVAATVGIRVGTHSWYSYGASTSHKREVRGSNAIQWRMITDAMAAGAEIYDLRGITDTVDADDPTIGLIQFKVGTGGEAVEYVGEWDLPINGLLYKAFDLYMRRR